MDKKAITYRELANNLNNRIISADTFKVEFEYLPNNDNILYIEDTSVHTLILNSGNISFSNIILTIKLIDIDKTYLYFNVLSAKTATENKIPVKYLYNGTLGYIENGDFFAIRHSGLPTPEKPKKITNIGTTSYVSQYTNAGSCFLVKSEKMLYKNITVENIITANYFSKYSSTLYLSYNLDNMISDNMSEYTEPMQYPNTTYKSVGSSWNKSYSSGTVPASNVNLFTYTLQDNKAFTIKIDDETNLIKKFGYFAWSCWCAMNTAKAQTKAMTYSSHFKVNISFNFYPCYKNINGLHKISTFYNTSTSTTVKTEPIFNYTKNLSLNISNSNCWSQEHTSYYYTHYAACVGIDVNDLLSQSNVSYTKIGNEIYIYYKNFLIAELIRNTSGVFLKMYCDISIDVPAGGVAVYCGINSGGTRNSVANVTSDNILFYPTNYMPYDNSISVNTIYNIAKYPNETPLIDFLPNAYNYFEFYNSKQGIYLRNIDDDNDNFENYLNRLSNINDVPNKCVTDVYLYNMTNDLNCCIYNNVSNTNENKVIVYKDFDIINVPITFSIKINLMMCNAENNYTSDSEIFNITYNLIAFKLNEDSNMYSLLYKATEDIVKLWSTKYDVDIDEFDTYATFNSTDYDGDIFTEDEVNGQGIFLEYIGDSAYNCEDAILYHNCTKSFLTLNNILSKCCTSFTQFNISNILNGSTIIFYADKVF